MTDSMYQHRTELPLDAAHPESVISEVTETIRALEDQAESRPFPLALDWSNLVIAVSPDRNLGLLRVMASAPVL